MIKNFIFDWTGTLSDGVQQFYEICQIIFSQYGKEMISLEEVKEEMTIPYMVFWNKYFPEMTLEEQRKLYDQAVLNTNDPQLYAGVKEFLRELNEQKIKVVILSSDPYFKLFKETKEGNIFPFFLDIVGEIHEKGPALKEVIQKHNFNPEETVYVGDTDGDIKAGKEAGIKTVGITWGINNAKKLKQANPDFLVNNILELKRLL